jgi:hypothetical protein
MILNLTDQEVLEMCGGSVPESVRDKLERLASRVIRETFEDSREKGMSEKFFSLASMLSDDSPGVYLTTLHQTFDGLSSFADLDFSIRMSREVFMAWRYEQNRWVGSCRLIP